MKMRKYALWLIVFGAIFLNHVFHFILTKIPDGYALFRTLPFISDIRYGDYLLQKWFLVVVAFLILVWWLRTRRDIFKNFKGNLPFICLIAMVTFISHAYSFNRWFEFDDYRVIGHHYAVEGTPRQNEMGAGSSYYYGIGLIYLVVGWFGTQFELYNALGLFIYFLIGVTTFFIAGKLGANKKISALVALYFVTSPTYYRETLLMLELLGDGFKLLLFSISVFFLLSKFYPGAVIFTAAALEFGISRTHFIGLPLILMCILFRDRKEKNREWILSLIAFFIMSFLYVGVLGAHPPTVIDQTNWFNNLVHLVRISDTIFGVTIPHAVIVPTISFFGWLLNDYVYISPIIGGFIIVFLFYLSAILFLKKKFLSAKLTFLGLVMVVAAIIFPTLMGIRLVYKINLLTLQYKDIFPAAPTAYGVFSTFGMIFILIGLSQVARAGLFKKILVFFIAINAITIIKSDIEWVKQYSAPQRAVNIQLNTLLPYDGKTKVVYTPPPTQVLSRYISYFYQLYRIKETLHFTNDPNEFIRLLKESKPEKERVFLLVLDIETNEVIDLSNKVREYYPEREITPEILAKFTK